MTSQLTQNTGHSFSNKGEESSLNDVGEKDAQKLREELKRERLKTLLLLPRKQQPLSTNICRFLPSDSRLVVVEQEFRISYFSFIPFRIF